MAGYQGGQTVKEGFYLKRTTGEFMQLYGDNLILPGSMEVKYLKVSAAVVVVAGPFAGLAFIIFLPLTGIIGIIGFLAYKAGQWMHIFGRKTLQPAVTGSKADIDHLTRQDDAHVAQEVARTEAMGLGQFLQPLIDGLECELMVVDLDFRITQYLTPLSSQNKALKQTVIGQHCFEVTHGRNSPCESRECECPVRKALETNGKVTVTHYHESQLEGKGKKRLVNILASPVRDSQGNIIQVAELIWEADIAKQIVPGAQKQR